MRLERRAVTKGVLPVLLAFIGRRRSLSRCFHHIVQQSLEIFQARSWNDNRITASAYIFSDAEETAANILFQREHKGLAFNLDLVRLERILIDGRSWLSEGTWVMVVVPVR